MNRKVGKVSWNSPALNTNNNNNEQTKKIPFLTMSGYGKSWRVRIVSEDPLRYWCHFTTDKNGQTAKVNCSLDENCPVHVEKTKSPCGGNQAEARFYLKALDRSDGTVRVLDVGKQIINGIGGYIDNPDWGHCKGYDVTIKKGDKGSMPLYTVAPSPAKPLTEAELQLAADSEDPDHENFIDLESRIKPLTAETINKILKGGDSTTSAAKPTAVTAASAAKKPAPVKVAPKEDENFEINWDET